MTSSSSSSILTEPDPFQPILSKSDNGDPAAIRTIFSNHRSSRQLAQHDLLVQSSKVKPDPILKSILEANNDESLDPRHCITLVSRPEQDVKEAIMEIQERVRKLAQEIGVADSIWFSPKDKLHMTLFEWISGSDQETVESISKCFDEAFLNKLNERPEPAPILDSPTLSYDQSALALSFLPSLPTSSSYQNYLKYRHDLYLSSLDFYQRHNEHNIKAGSQNFTLPPPSPRYVLPSAHISIARFVEEIPKEKIQVLKNGLQKISEEIEEHFKELKEVMRDENQLCIGRNWYGGGKVLKP